MASEDSSVPRPNEFPPGGHTAPGDELTCDRCGDLATKGYEGAGADGFLNLCDDCFEDFGRWLDAE